MDDLGVCPECGANEYLSFQHQWLNNGDIVMQPRQTERIIFFDSDNLDPLMSGIEEILGVSIEHLIISACRTSTRKYLKSLLPDNVGAMMRDKVLDLETVDDGFREIAKLCGLGKYEFVDMRYEQDEKDFFTVKITKPFSLLMSVAGHAAALEAIMGFDHGVTYSEVGPGAYNITAFPSEHPQELKGKMLLLPYYHKDGDMELEKCETCGSPTALSWYYWDLDVGIIAHKKNGRRMVIQGPLEIEPIFHELENELGDTVPEIIVEAQRRFTKTGFYTMEMISDVADFRTQLALRGLGNLKDLNVGKKGLRMRLDNATLHLVIVGMMQGMFDTAFNSDSTVEWELSDDQQLQLKVTPKS